MSKDNRPPGPVNVQRFEGGFSRSGLPTFFRKPVALTPEDLKAGKVDVAILGAGVDMGSGMRGAVYGPNAFRTAEKYLGWGAWSDPNLHVMVDWEKELTVVDYGDAPVDYLSAERSMEPIRKMVREAEHHSYEDQVRPAPKAEEGGQQTVLLVEDADRVREVVREILELSGYRVLEAHDGPSRPGTPTTRPEDRPPPGVRSAPGRSGE